MADWTTNHQGDPEYGERKFVDPGPYLPPLHERGRDPYFKDARTYADVAAEEAAATPSGVAQANLEPGRSEFGWGRGLMAPLIEGHEPTQIETLKAIQRTNPADPGAVHQDRYQDWIRE